ncbi:hypothetical protein D3C79_890020 [compost metagenome]
MLASISVITPKPAVAAITVPYPTSALVLTIGRTVFVAPTLIACSLLSMYFQKIMIERSTVSINV